MTRPRIQPEGPMRCEAVMNTHLAMGWTPCGKRATRIVTKGGSDFAVCPEHAAQNADLPQRAVPATLENAHAGLSSESENQT